MLVSRCLSYQQQVDRSRLHGMPNREGQLAMVDPATVMHPAGEGGRNLTGSTITVDGGLVA